MRDFFAEEIPFPKSLRPSVRALDASLPHQKREADCKKDEADA
jgi:hypothetical protein